MSRLSVRTTLARNFAGRLSLRGFDVVEDLVDSGFWSTVCIALGGRALTADEERMAAVLGILAPIGDPRIWPYKLARLIGSYGRVCASTGAAYLVLDDAVIGPQAAGRAAELFCVNNTMSVDEHLATVCERLDEVIARGGRAPGFGVPARAEDERTIGFRHWMGRSGVATGPNWKMFERASEHMLEHHGLAANFAGPIAAVSLDLGLRPDQVHPFCSFLTHWGYLANGYEGTREAPEVLRRLPDEFVRYKGPAPRKSPRALAAGRDSDG